MEIMGISVANPKMLLDHREVVLQEALYFVAKRTGVRAVDILGGCHSRQVVRAKRMLAKMLRERRFSYPEIGRFMNKHHTTIQHLVKGSR